MDATRFDTVAKLFAARRTRRQTLARAGTGLAAGALAAAGLAHAALAQDATPAVGAAGEEVEYLFVQSFQSGTIAPRAGADDTYTLTLEQGLGQTIHFSDRPERIVGASPTPQFLHDLGFPPDNPPNAALVVEADPGTVDLAVLELFNPTYDEATHTATYDVTALAEWRDALGVGLTEEPADLAVLTPTFGAAHLFIDGCPNKSVNCYNTCSSGGMYLAGGFNVPACGFQCDTPCSGWDIVTQTCAQSIGLSRNCVKADWAS